MTSPAPTSPSSASDTDGPGESQVSARILVVDDEKVIREILCEFLALEGYVVRGVEDGQKALTELRLRPYDIVISDLKMPKVSGLELLERVTSEKLDVLTVIMTGFGTVETAIEAMKKGAYDYILKPFKVEEVVHIVQRGLDRQRLQQENIRLREALTLYKVSEAMATSLDLDHVLDVILHATVHEVQCDVATLHLADPQTGRYEERIRLCSDTLELGGQTVPAPNPHELMQFFHRGTPILAHGVKANRFLDTIGGGPGGKPLVSYAAVPLQVSSRVIGMLNVFSFTRGKQFDEGQRKMLAILASRAAASIENARLYDDLLVKNEELRKANQSLEENFQQTVAGFAQALEESDRYTRGHSERVAMYAELLAVGIGLPDGEVETVVKAGLMHDIGKIGIRYELINKPGKLSPEEVSMFREHPDKGRRILAPIPCMRAPDRGRLVPPRVLRRRRLPARPGQGQHPAARPHRRHRRRLRRDDQRPRLPPRAQARGRGGRDRALLRHPVRPGAGRAVPRPHRGAARRRPPPRRAPPPGPAVGITRSR